MIETLEVLAYIGVTYAIIMLIESIAHPPRRDRS